MPMGVTNGNAAFQRMLENLLEPVREEQFIVFSALCFCFSCCLL